MPTERDRKIRDLAYRLWDEDGRQEGQSERYWLQAERTFAASSGSVVAEPAPESLKGKNKAAKGGKAESGSDQGSAAGSGKGGADKPKGAKKDQAPSPAKAEKPAASGKKGPSKSGAKS
jgi:hypothetical protein